MDVLTISGLLKMERQESWSRNNNKNRHLGCSPSSLAMFTTHTKNLLMMPTMHNTGIATITRTWPLHYTFPPCNYTRRDSNAGDHCWGVTDITFADSYEAPLTHRSPPLELRLNRTFYGRISVIKSINKRAVVRDARRRCLLWVIGAGYLV